ncbi:unnamed protein product [Caenorhabditis brenneri]
MEFSAQPGAPAPPTVQGEDVDTQRTQESKRQRMKKIKEAEEQLIKAMVLKRKEEFEMEQERRAKQLAERKAKKEAERYLQENRRRSSESSSKDIGFRPPPDSSRSRSPITRR